MQLISQFNKGFRFLFYAFDVYSRYSWVVSLKDKKGITIASAFQNIYNRSTKSGLQDNDIEKMKENLLLLKDLKPQKAKYTNT